MCITLFIFMYMYHDVQFRECKDCLSCLWQSLCTTFFSQVGTQIHYPIKTNLNTNSTLFKKFWYYMHFQIRECTINVSHTSFWYPIKACVLQHLLNTLPYFINWIQICFVTHIIFSIHTKSSWHSSSAANVSLWSPENTTALTISRCLHNYV